MKFTWKITELMATDGLITSAKYKCELGDDPKVETEGYWYFDKPSLKTPFDQVTEQMVVDWINAEAIRDGKNLITSRLEEQLAAISNPNLVIPPWKPQLFKLQI